MRSLRIQAAILIHATALLFRPALAVAQNQNAQNQNAKPLTLFEAITIALQKQPTLAQATANREASAQRVQQQRANYYPTITPQYTQSENYSYAPVTQITPAETGTGTTVTTVTTTTAGQSSSARQGEVALSYRLFDTGTRELNNRQARQNLRASSYSEADTRQNTIANVAIYYYATLQNNALVTVAQSQVERAQNTLDVTRAQAEAGTIATKDVYQAKADALNAQVNLLQAKNNATVSQAQLRQALGIAEDSGPLALADVTAPTEDTPLTAVATDASLKSLKEAAYKARPDIARVVQNADVYRTGVRIAQVNAGLTLTADVGMGYTYSPYNGNDRRINFAASYPLFDGGLVRSQVRESRANVRSGDAQVESVRLQAAVEVEQAYRNLEQARASLPASRLARQAAQINYEAAIESRKEGVGSLVDVITAQTSLVQAQTNYVNAVYTFYSADAALAKAVGQADRIGTQRTSS